MQIKRYEAANIQDALIKIKKDLGSEAIVLSTKRLPGKGRGIEVLAARDIEPSLDQLTDNREISLRAGKSGEAGELFAYVRKEMAELKSLVRDVSRETFAADAELKDSMHAFFDVLGRHDRSGCGSISRLYHYLVSRGMSKGRACKILEDMKRNHPAQETFDYEKGLARAEKLLMKTFPEARGESGKRIKIFIGPTGVGKTTTLAKLAAHYALEKKLTVGLITTDTYRIAAPEQLKIYARIMGLPLEVTSEKKLFRQSLEQFRDRDVVLVDTPGGSHRDDDFLAKLRGLVAKEREIETNLLLSLTSSRENLLEVIQRFQQFDCDHLIFTKADECHTCGVVCEVLEQAKKPVTYITTGQDVPKDIEQADPHRLARLVMRH